MKKVLALLLVFGMASVASADVIYVAMDSAGSNGHAGTAESPFDVGETVGISLILGHNPYPQYPSYDGYFLVSMDLSLVVNGPGKLFAPEIKDKNGNVIGYDIGVNAGLDVPGGDPMIVDGGVDRMIYGSLAGISGANDTGGDARVALIWNLTFECTGPGSATIDLVPSPVGSNGGEFFNFTDLSNAKEYLPTGGGIIDDSLLGDLTIHQVPEPMTLALLGLGSLGLLRRRRA
jgi:hypothetical protein